MGNNRRHGSGNHMRGTVVCRHREKVTVTDREQVGVCLDCGQRVKYTFDGGRPEIIKRGRLKGRWTQVKPPPLKASSGES